MAVFDRTDNPVVWQEYVTQARRTSQHVASLRLLAPFLIVIIIAAVASNSEITRNFPRANWQSWRSGASIRSRRCTH